MKNNGKDYVVITYLNKLGDLEYDFILQHQSNYDIGCVVTSYLDREDITLVSVDFGDKEFYLNKRLEYRISEYQYLNKRLDETCEKWLDGEYFDTEVLKDTINCINEALKVNRTQVHLIILRMVTEDVDLYPQNEFGYMINDEYVNSEIKRKEELYENL